MILLSTKVIHNQMNIYFDYHLININYLLLWFRISTNSYIILYKYFYLKIYIYINIKWKKQKQEQVYYINYIIRIQLIKIFI
jgi:hypothetical protein